MKNIFKIVLVGIIISLTSCSDSETLIDQVYDSVDTTSGVVVRTVVKPQDLVSLTNEANNAINMTLEVQEGNGSIVPDFKEIRVYARLFSDQDVSEPITTDDGGEIAELLVDVLDSSIFEISNTGLPRSDVSIPTQNLVDAYEAAGASLSNLPVPTFVALRLELEMSDGRVFTTTEVSAAVGGGIYFASPFFYRIIFLPV